ncbi:MAG TPA: phosphatase PAP2 family protein [Thermoleophilaceae bacterium]|nr:phosphatase PAP2 family protein [Thermoleophilaceae bacterium]
MRTTRVLRRLAWGAVAVGVITPLVRHRLKLRPPVVSALTWPAPAALALAEPRSPLRDAGIYALQMWAYFAHFDMADDDPDALMRRLKVDYPIRCDRALGLGECPTTRLQRVLGREGRVGRLDYALSAIHWSWFLVPHGTLAYMLLRHREHYPRSAVLMSACFDLGCVIYWAVPTAPPWWAGLNGSLQPVRRIMEEAGERFWKGLWRPLYHSLQGNPFAAMPSLHFGTSVMAARILSRVGPAHAALGWLYTALLGFGLVYLGEHYVVDLVAGLALAEGIWRVAPRFEPVVRFVAGAVHRLEPRVA